MPGMTSSSKLTLPLRRTRSRMRSAPDQEGAAAILRNLVSDQPLVDGGDGFVPVIDGRAIGGRRPIFYWQVAHRHVEFYPARVRVGDEAVADMAAQFGEIVLVRALVRNEQHLGAVQAVNGLDGHVVGIAGADADDEKLAHGTISCPIETC